MALHESVKLGKGIGVECTMLLLNSGANIDVTLVTNSNTLLHEAASIGADEICRLLIEQNGKAVKEDGASSSPSTSTYLSKSNSYGNAPIHSAVRSGSVDTVRLLMEHDADVNTVNHLGSTVLHLCAFLVEDTEKSNSSSTGESTSNERRLKVEPHLQIAALLLASGKFKDIDFADSNGHTALHIASQRGCIELVKLLIDSGASLSVKTTIDYKGRGGRNAAGMAKFSGMKSTYEMLVEIDEAIIVTGKMAKDLEGGYSMSNPIVGSAGAVVRRRSYTLKGSESEASSACLMK